MKERANDLINWAYALSQYLEEYEVEEYNDYEIESTYHDFMQRNGEIVEVYVGACLKCDGFETNPLGLIETVRNAGFEIQSTNVDWNHRELRLGFVYEL